MTSECLTNAAKHARASFVEVSARVDGDVLEVTIADDGVGGADLGHGSGLIGLVDRVEAIGGRLRVTSPPGRAPLSSYDCHFPGRRGDRPTPYSHGRTRAAAPNSLTG